MTKTTAALGTLGLGATTAIATPLALKYGGVRNENNTLLFPSVEVKARTRWGGSKIPLSSSTDVKSKYKDIDCLKDLPGTENKWTEDQEQTGNPSIFLIANTAKDSGANSCLMVEYYKQEQNEKWKGGFKLVWSISNSQGGLVTVINVDADEGKLILDSSIYVLSSNRIINYREEGKSHEITDSSGLSEYFPKIGTSIKNGETDDYWGFGPEIDKICKDTSECSNITGSQTPTSKQWKWNKNGSDSDLITDFSSNFENWFLKLFDSKWSTVKDSLKDIKGKWTLNSDFK